MIPRCSRCDVNGVWTHHECKCPKCGDALATLSRKFNRRQRVTLVYGGTATIRDWFWRIDDKQYVYTLFEHPGYLFTENEFVTVDESASQCK